MIFHVLFLNITLTFTHDTSSDVRYILLYYLYRTILEIIYVTLLIYIFAQSLEISVFPKFFSPNGY